MQILFEKDKESAFVKSSFFKNECILYGPYIMLEPGEYEVRFSIFPVYNQISRFFSIFKKDFIIATIEVTSNCGNTILIQKDLMLSNYKDSCLKFSIDQYTTDIEFRVFSKSLPIMCSYNRELKKIYNTSLSLPTLDNKKMFFVETTSKCNMNCIFCTYSSKQRNDSILDTVKVKNLIDDIALYSDNKEKVVSFEMLGEPLLNHDIFELVRYTKDKNLYTSFISNGLLLNKNIARKINDSGIDSLMISLHTPYIDDQSFTKLRGIEYNFISYMNKLLEFLEELICLKSKIHIYIYIQSNEGIKNLPGLGRLCKWDWFTDQKDLDEKLNKLFSIFESFSKKMIKLYPSSYNESCHKEMLKSGRIVTERKLIDMDAFYHNSDTNFFQGYMFFPNMLIQFKSFGLVTNESHFLNNSFDFKDGQYAFVEDNETDFSCPDLVQNGAINSDGNVCLCCGDCDNEFSIGNIYTCSLDEIYRSDSYQQVCKHPYISKICKRCKGKIIFLDERDTPIFLSGQISDGKFPFFLKGTAKIYTVCPGGAERIDISICKNVSFLQLYMKILRTPKKDKGVNHINFVEDFTHQIDFLYEDNISVFYTFESQYLYKIEISPVLGFSPLTHSSIQINKIEFI